jgi:DNA-binding NarL/FixJ family response regulator
LSERRHLSSLNDEQIAGEVQRALPWQDGDKVIEKVRVLIADDQPVARKALRVLLATWPELEVVGEAANAQEAIQKATQLRPDIVLMDVRMPGSAQGSTRDLGGIEATKQIKECCPAIQVIVLTMYGTFQKEALEAQADAFLLKGGSAERLIETIHHLRRDALSWEGKTA